MPSNRALHFSDFGSIPEGPSPLYHRIASHITELVVRQKPPAGTKLPTEEQLARHFNVSIITIRAALKELADDGIIERQQGRGTFIRQNAPPPAEWSLGSIEDLATTGRASEIRVVRCGHRSPPSWARPLLGIAGSETCFNLEIVRSRSGVPFLVTDAYYPKAIGDRLASIIDIEQHLREARLLVELVERVTGDRVTNIKQTMVAIAAPPEIAKLLHIDAGTPILMLTRVSQTADGRIVQVARSFYCTEGFAYALHLTRT